jgi:hypothetical protein
MDIQPVDPALDDDSRPASLFETLDGKFLAVCLDRAGASLPRANGENWQFQTEFRLGVHEPVPVAIDPEPLLRGIKANGYFVWPANRTLPMGSAQ